MTLFVCLSATSGAKKCWLLCQPQLPGQLQLTEHTILLHTSVPDHSSSPFSPSLPHQLIDCLLGSDGSFLVLCQGGQSHLWLPILLLLSTLSTLDSMKNHLLLWCRCHKSPHCGLLLTCNSVAPSPVFGL